MLRQSSLMTFCFALCTVTLLAPGNAQEVNTQEANDDAVTDVYPLAIFPFQERGREVSDLGKQVSDLLFAGLVVNPELYLVEREDLAKMLEEQELNISGIVHPGSATRVGQLTGAKILISGSVMEINGKLYLVAKIIGTETSRVVGASVKGNAGDEIDVLAEKLAAKVSETIVARADELVAKADPRKDRIASLQKKLGDARRPAVWVSIAERHVGVATIDPAAETEFSFFCKELGFNVIDSKAGNKADADILITGEGFSEFAARHGNLQSVKARVEIKAIDRVSGEVIAIDRDVSVAVDLTEQIAGKDALQEAAANIAVRMLPKLVKDKDKGKAKRKKKNPFS